MPFFLSHIFRGVYRNFAEGANLGYLKKGGAAASSVRGSTGRQCLKISLVILRVLRLTDGGGG